VPTPIILTPQTGDCAGACLTLFYPNLR